MLRLRNQGRGTRTPPEDSTDTAERSRSRRSPSALPQAGVFEQIQRGLVGGGAPVLRLESARAAASDFRRWSRDFPAPLEPGALLDPADRDAQNTFPKQNITGEFIVETHEMRMSECIFTNLDMTPPQ